MFKSIKIFNEKKIYLKFFLKNFYIKENKIIYYKFLKNLNFLKILNLNLLNIKNNIKNFKFLNFLCFILILKKKIKLKLIIFKTLFKIKNEQIKYKLFKLLIKKFTRKKLFFENNKFIKIFKHLKIKNFLFYNIKKIINLKKFKNYKINIYKNKNKKIFSFKKSIYINNILKLNNICLLKNFINKILLEKIKFNKILIKNE